MKLSTLEIKQSLNEDSNIFLLNASFFVFFLTVVGIFSEESMAEEEEVVTKSIRLPVTIDIALRNIKHAKVRGHSKWIDIKNERA